MIPGVAGTAEAVPRASPNGWTGGQYSLGRLLIAGMLLIHFWVRGWEAQGSLEGLVAVALAVLSGVVALGFGGRSVPAAAWVLLLGATLSGLYPHAQFAAYVLVALSLHLWLPPAPFGSFDAFGRLDPAGTWRFPERVGQLAWLLLGFECALRGGLELSDEAWRSGSALAELLRGPAARSPLGSRLLGGDSGLLAVCAWSASLLKLLFVLSAFTGRARRPAWMLLFFANLLALLLFELSSEGLGRLLVLPFAFAPVWIPARRAPVPELLFYDGACGLCHRAVRFLVAEDPGGQALRFAPLHGERFKSVVPEALRDRLPDSLVLVTGEGEALDKSRAALHALAALGGLWRLLSWLGSAVPVALADPLYDAIARVRHRLFETPGEACPMLPIRLRERFDP